MESVQDAIRRGELRPGLAIPSMNELGRQLAVSRETVFKAYRELKARGIYTMEQMSGQLPSTLAPSNMTFVSK